MRNPPQNHGTQLGTDEIPKELFEQMTNRQTATNEFLRQFWMSMHPPPASKGALVLTPAQRTAKIAKMIVYLSKTHEQVEALVHPRYGLDSVMAQTVCVLLCC